MKQVVILGVGKTGRSAQDFLARLGVGVRLFDDSWEEYDWRPVLATFDFSDVSAVLVSPGIPFQHPVVEKARRQGAPVVSDVDMFRAAVGPALWVGVTGTNGKSTTTALVKHLLQQVYPGVELGGNIGKPVLDLLKGDVAMEARVAAWLLSLDRESKDTPRRTDWPRGNLRESLEAAQRGESDLPPLYVLELSSFQLAWSHNLDLDVAIWTNVTPDHLDRHGSFEAYAEAKKKIFDGAEFSVMGIDDGPSRETWVQLKRRHQTVQGLSVLAPSKGDAEFSDAFVDVDGTFYDKAWKAQVVADRTLEAADFPEKGSTSMKPSASCEGRLEAAPELNFSAFPNLIGRHNWQNMALATLAARYAGVPEAALREGLRTFRGLPHRLEEVGRWPDDSAATESTRKVVFVNDSKATNAESTIVALESFPNDLLYLIAGGRPKSEGIAPAVPFMKRVACVFLLGEASDRFAEELGISVPHMACGNLEMALAEAWKAAQRNDTFGRRHLHDLGRRVVVLLSPACASFDQFRSYEDRGDVFRELVKRVLQRERERGGCAEV